LRRVSGIENKLIKEFFNSFSFKQLDILEEWMVMRTIHPHK
jgi:hypothetical protein